MPAHRATAAAGAAVARERNAPRYTMRQRRLNPCDCVFHALDQRMRAQGYPGTGTFIMIDAEGPCAPDRIRTGIARTLATHPTTAARAATSAVRAWPVWRPTREPVTPHYTFDDLSGLTDDWLAESDRRFRARYSAMWDPHESAPQVRIEHVLGPGGQQRVIIRWPHALMDADGAQLFLAEIDRLSQPDPPPPRANLLPDRGALVPIRRRNILKRLALIPQALRTRDRFTEVSAASLCEHLPQRPTDSRELSYLVRPWSAEQTALMQAAAKAVTPRGPGLYSRYIGTCVLRALYRIHTEYGHTLPVYALSFPMGVPGLTQRPIPGNYLVAASLFVPAGQLPDRHAVATTLTDQMQRYQAENRADASQVLQWLMAELRQSQYQMLFNRLTDRQPFATGYSFYGEISPPLETFGGARVTNMWGCGALSVPPGWNVTMTRFRDRISLAIAWPAAAFPPDVVEHYADLIEEEVFTAAPASEARSS
jgi:hypothetical protein